MVREFLDERGVEYTRRRVGIDPAAGADFVERGWRLPPVIEIGDEVIEGYQPDAIDAALGL